ncbi:hypothetical protein [Rhodococcus qingshengii]|nr:hypothetical protein [Rhodococcus qingshengii]
MVSGAAASGDARYPLAEDGRLVMSGQALLVIHSFGGGIENATASE